MYSPSAQRHGARKKDTLAGCKSFATPRRVASGEHFGMCLVDGRASFACFLPPDMKRIRSKTEVAASMVSQMRINICVKQSLKGSPATVATTELCAVLHQTFRIDI